MSWKRPRRAGPALAGWAVWGAALAAVILLSAHGALALGPFSHLTFARQIWPELAQSQGFKPDAPGLREAMYAGCLAPDAGYYPGAESNLAEAAHLVQPWAFAAALRELAQSDTEKAFALGWLSHALLDLRGHGELINPWSGGAFQDARLAHKEIEWGLDAWLLAKPEGAWLWEAPMDGQAGLNLWQRALQQVYGASVGQEVISQAQDAQLKEVARLPYVWWFSGRLDRPGHALVNGLGWAVGGTLRPAYMAWLKWRDTGFEVRAVLGARRPSPDQVRDLRALFERVRTEMSAVLAGREHPQGSLDADPDCAPESCPQAAPALAWLRGRAEGSGPAPGRAGSIKD